MKLTLLFVLIVMLHFIDVEGLKANDTGVCVVTRSVKKTQRRVYIAKYKCGKKICSTRRNKIKDYIVTQNDILCCKGWTYSSTLDACSPLCSMGCIGGRCTAPDVCQCDLPATLDPASKNACYLPKCDPPCSNGTCTANNTCTCLFGYEKVNNACQPKCESCQNGRCISPNNCQCNEDYIKINGTCSLPKCQPECINGKCMANNTCICLNGYEKVDSICQPKCESCQNGNCTAPDMCECFDGYERVNNICQPKCEFCQNGRCTAPNKCECYDGYAKSDGVCRPLCVKVMNVTSSTCECDSVSGRCYTPCKEDCVVCDDSGICRRPVDCG